MKHVSSSLLCQRVTAPISPHFRRSNVKNLHRNTFCFLLSVKGWQPPMHCTLETKKWRICTETRCFLVYVSKGDSLHALHFRRSKVKNFHRKTFYVPLFCVKEWELSIFDAQRWIICTKTRLVLAFMSKGDSSHALHLRRSKVRNLYRNTFVARFSVKGWQSQRIALKTLNCEEFAPKDVCSSLLCQRVTAPRTAL